MDNKKYIGPFNVSLKEQLCEIFMFFNKNKDVIKLNYETVPTNCFDKKDIESLVKSYD